MAVSASADSTTAVTLYGPFARPRMSAEPRPALPADGEVSEVTAPGGVTDEALAVQARRDPEAFGRLYERYADRVYGLVYSRTRHGPTAEDVTAEVFFKALRAIDQFQPHRPFRAWLFQIAVNAVTDHFRRQRPTAPLEESGDRAANGVSVEDQALDRAELAQVWSVLETLSDPQRTALVLRLGLDLNTADIAASMGRSEGAVKLLIHRGLRTVRQRLAPAAVEEAAS